MTEFYVITIAMVGPWLLILGAVWWAHHMERKMYTEEEKEQCECPCCETKCPECVKEEK